MQSHNGEGNGLNNGAGSRFSITINGKLIPVNENTSIAAAMVMAGEPSRFSVRGTARAPFCGMGICMECRATVNGVCTSEPANCLCSGHGSGDRMSANFDVWWWEPAGRNGSRGSCFGSRPRFVFSMTIPLPAANLARLSLQTAAQHPTERATSHDVAVAPVNCEVGQAGSH